MDSQKVNKALRILADDVTLKVGGRANADRIKGQLQITNAKNPLRLWQFVCPPKTTLGANEWLVENDLKYDVFAPSIAKTKGILAGLDKMGVAYTMTIYYPDDEVLKARASGIKLAKMEPRIRDLLVDKLSEISLERCLSLQEVAGPNIRVVMWSEISGKYGLDIDSMFATELAFWKEQGTKNVGYFAQTQRWLTQTFGFKPELAWELTARRIAKYAVEGKVIAQIYPAGSIYLNNEYPYREPWSMYTAAVSIEERKQMAVSYYMCD